MKAITLYINDKLTVLIEMASLRSCVPDVAEAFCGVTSASSTIAQCLLRLYRGAADMSMLLSVTAIEVESRWRTSVLSATEYGI